MACDYRPMEYEGAWMWLRTKYSSGANDKFNSCRLPDVLFNVLGREGVVNTDYEQRCNYKTEADAWAALAVALTKALPAPYQGKRPLLWIDGSWWWYYGTCVSSDKNGEASLPCDVFDRLTGGTLVSKNGRRYGGAAAALLDLWEATHTEPAAQPQAQQEPVVVVVSKEEPAATESKLPYEPYKSGDGAWYFFNGGVYSDESKANVPGDVFAVLVGAEEVVTAKKYKSKEEAVAALTQALQTVAVKKAPAPAPASVKPKVVYVPYRRSDRGDYVWFADDYGAMPLQARALPRALFDKVVGCRSKPLVMVGCYDTASRAVQVLRDALVQGKEPLRVDGKYFWFTVAGNNEQPQRLEEELFAHLTGGVLDSVALFRKYDTRQAALDDLAVALIALVPDAVEPAAQPEQPKPGNRHIRHEGNVYRPATDWSGHWWWHLREPNHTYTYAVPPSLYWHLRGECTDGTNRRCRYKTEQEALADLERVVGDQTLPAVTIRTSLGFTPVSDAGGGSSSGGNGLVCAPHVAHSIVRIPEPPTGVVGSVTSQPVQGAGLDGVQGASTSTYGGYGALWVSQYPAVACDNKATGEPEQSQPEAPVATYSRNPADYEPQHDPDTSRRMPWFWNRGPEKPEPNQERYVLPPDVFYKLRTNSHIWCACATREEALAELRRAFEATAAVSTPVIVPVSVSQGGPSMFRAIVSVVAFTLWAILGMVGLAASALVAAVATDLLSIEQATQYLALCAENLTYAIELAGGTSLIGAIKAAKPHMAAALRNYLVGLVRDQISNSAGQ